MKQTILFVLSYVLVASTSIAQIKLEDQRVTPRDSVNYLNYGRCVDLYGDWAVVGAYNDDFDSLGGNQSFNDGSVYLYEFDGSEWKFGQKITLPETHQDFFGEWVKLQEDYLFVGAPHDSRGGFYADSAIDDAGLIHTYSLQSDGTWKRGNKFTRIPSLHRAEDGSFGDMFDVSSADLIACDARGVYIYPTNGGAPSFPGAVELTLGPDSNSIEFASYVAIDESYAVIGMNTYAFDAEGNNELTDAGAVYVFRKSGIFWEFEQMLVADNRREDEFFGEVVEVADGAIIVGSEKRTYIFRKQEGTWKQTQVLSYPNMPKYRVQDLEYSSPYLAVSSIDFNHADTNEIFTFPAGGSVLFIELSNGLFIQRNELFHDLAGGLDGNGYSVSFDGRKCISGAPFVDFSFYDGMGAAYFYTFPKHSLGLSEVSDENSISIYPNPSNSLLNIVSSDEEDGDAHLSVYSVTGSLIYSEETFMLNGRTSTEVSNLPNGAYYIEVAQGSSVEIEQFVVSR